MTRGKLLLSLALAMATLGAAVVWSQRGPLVASWQVRQMSHISDDRRETQMRSLAACGEDAVRPLLASLASADEVVCRNMELGLRAVAGEWPIDDARTLRTVEAIRERFTSLSLPGRKSLLSFTAALAGRDDDLILPASIARVLGELVEISEPIPELRPAGLGLAGALVEHAPPGQWQSMCRGLALKWLGDESAATRIAAIQIVLREPLRKDVDLLARIVPALHDAEPGVRRVALVALGTNTDVVREEHLLPLLHDTDAEVQRLCEAVLRSRGLSDTHVRMARLISHESPSVRLQVIPFLRQAADLDADVWLRRLTLDPAPAVRAAAVRVASVDVSDDLRHRLAEMARADPSPTVREIARFYVDRSTVRRAGK